MRGEVKYVLYLIGLGMGLVAYAHSQFSTKAELQTVKTTVEKMDERIYQIWKEVVKE
jgi:hypothetical protein